MAAPPKRPLRADPTCAAKRRHPDEPTARAHAMFALAEYRTTTKLYVYRCPHCNGWHLTRNNNGWHLTRNNNGRHLLVTVDNPVHEGAQR